MKYVLLSDDELIKLARLAKESGDVVRVALILEVLEFRNAYGPLGCHWLSYEMENGFYRTGRGLPKSWGKNND